MMQGGSELPPEGKVIYWIRHGEALHNVVSQAAKDAGRSDWERRQKMQDEALEDAPLTSKGEEQARHLRAQLESGTPSLPLDLVLVSPLRRAQQTASIVFGSHVKGGPGTVSFLCVPDCRERMSSLKSEKRSDLAKLRLRYPHCDFSLIPTDEEEDKQWTGVYEYESSLFERTRRFLGFLSQRPERHIAVVTHSAFLKTGMFHKDNKQVSYPGGDLADRNLENCELRSTLLTWDDHQGEAVISSSSSSAHPHHNGISAQPSSASSSVPSSFTLVELELGGWPLGKEAESSMEEDVRLAGLQEFSSGGPVALASKL